MGVCQYLCCPVDKHLRRKNFYLIGICGKGRAFEHEMAHGLFSAVPKYKKEVLKLIATLPEVEKTQICEVLAKLGYAKRSFNDEIQAFLATGLYRGFDTLSIRALQQPFIELFNRYYKG